MTSKSLIKKLGLKIAGEPHSIWPGSWIKFPIEMDVKKFYGDKVKIQSFSNNSDEAHLESKPIIIKICPYHWNNGGVQLFYSYPGQGYVVSDKLIPYDDIVKLYNLKSNELNNAQNKRANKIKNGVDVIRVTLLKNKIDFRRITCGYEVNLGFVGLRFTNEANRVDISLSWRELGGISTKAISNIDLANPKFEDIILGYIKHGKNIIKDLIEKAERHDHKTNTQEDGQDPQEDQAKETEDSSH
jgi:hypothetical protein